jgi:hypothetical protein
VSATQEAVCDEHVRTWAYLGALHRGRVAWLANLFPPSEGVIAWLLNQPIRGNPGLPWDPAWQSFLRRVQTREGNEQHDLGTLTRLLCIVHLLFVWVQAERRGGITDAVLAKDATEGIYRKRYSLVSALTQALVFGKDGLAWAHEWTMPTTGDIDWPAGLERFVCRLRRGHGAPQVTLEHLLNERVCLPDEVPGPTAVARYIEWVRRGSTLSRDNLRRLHCEPFAGNLILPMDNSRHEQLQSALDAIVGFQREHETICSATDARPVVNVFSPSNWTALRAFATGIVFQSRRRDFRLCEDQGELAYFSIVYVPLQRLPHTMGRGAAYADDQTYTRQEALRLLRRSFGLADSGSRGGADPAKDFAELQLMLALNRTLLIFDGYAVSPPPFDPLIDLIRNSDWPDLIRSLVHPTLEVLEKSGGRFRSRVLLLSGRPVTTLMPWMAQSPVEMLPMKDQTTYYAAIVSPNDATAQLKDVCLRYSKLRRELNAEMQSLWHGGDFNRPVCEHRRSLPDIYLLKDSTAIALTSAEDFTAPNELHLAMAWCRQQLDIEDFLDLSFLRSPDRQLSTLLATLNRFSVGDAIAFRFIAAAINGMRRTTLVRCLLRYAELSAGERSSVLSTVDSLNSEGDTDSFLKRFGPLLIDTVDESVPALDETWRWFELQANAGTHLSRGRARELRLFDLRLEAIRELAFAEMTGSSGKFRRAPSQEETQQFRLIQQVLCEESLLQATAQLRNPRNFANYADRSTFSRFIQALFHGVLSLGNIDPVTLGEPARTLQHAEALPANGYARFVYLHSMVYRRCIENAPSWLLTRAFGRDDVRMALICMLINPYWAGEVLGALYRAPWALRSYSSFGACRRAGAWDFPDALKVDASHLKGEIGLDLFRSLMIAVRRSAMPEGMRDWAFASEDIRARAGSTVSERSIVLDKMKIDALLRGEDQQAVFDACTEALGAAAHDLGDPHEFGRSYVRSKLRAQHEHTMLRPVAEKLLRAGKSQAHLEGLGDVLYRLGEWVAINADRAMAEVDLDNPKEVATALSEFATSYSVYWIADRVRSGASTSEIGSLRWPAVSSRAFRYFVRTMLMISKLLGRLAIHTGDIVIRDEANAFYMISRGRIDVFARHLAHLPFERLNVLLLLASAARVRGTLARVVDNVPRHKTPYARQSLEYIKVAEDLHLQLGVNQGMLRRVTLERIKTLRQAIDDAEQGDENANRNALQRIVDRDEALLEEISADDPYWRELSARVRSMSRQDGAGRA